MNEMTRPGRRLFRMRHIIELIGQVIEALTVVIIVIAIVHFSISVAESPSELSR